VSSTVTDLAKVGDDPRGMLSALAKARALGINGPRPEDLTIAFEAGRAGAVVLTQLWYPRWHAVLSGPSGDSAVPISRVFHGIQAIDVPSAGSWTLRLTYDTRPDRIALAVSGLAWLSWGLLYWRTYRHRGDRGGATP
jgi:hypothetical protein